MLTEEQIKIRAWGENFNKVNREKEIPTADKIVQELRSNKINEERIQ